jgi:hypothetical protein
LKPCDSSQRWVWSCDGHADGLRALGQEDDLPAALAREACQAFDDARLQRRQAFPEIFDRFDVPPQAPLLARRHLQLEQRRDVVRRTIGRRSRIQHGVSRNAHGIRRIRRGPSLDAPGHRFAEQDFSLADQFPFHVREHAVEVEAYAQSHW